MVVVFGFGFGFRLGFGFGFGFEFRLLVGAWRVALGSWWSGYIISCLVFAWCVPCLLGDAWRLVVDGLLVRLVWWLARFDFVGSWWFDLVGGWWVVLVGSWWLAAGG